jgi:hypothetical protein
MAIVEIGEKIFRAPAKVENPPILKTLGKAFGKGKAQIVAPQLDALDRRADERGRQSPSHGFDFGQLWHEVD